MSRYIIKKLIIVSTIVSLVAETKYTANYENNIEDDCNDESNNDESSDVAVCIPSCTGGLYDQCQICTTHCPPTCERQHMPCLESCGPKGCQCVLGYVRDSNGMCILPEECPTAT